MIKKNQTLIYLNSLWKNRYMRNLLFCLHSTTNNITASLNQISLFGRAWREPTRTLYNTNNLQFTRQILEKQPRIKLSPQEPQHFSKYTKYMAPSPSYEGFIKSKNRTADSTRLDAWCLQKKELNKRKKLNETKRKNAVGSQWSLDDNHVLYPVSCTPTSLPMMPRPGSQALVVFRADKIVISALFASSLIRNNILLSFLVLSTARSCWLDSIIDSCFSGMVLFKVF